MATLEDRLVAHLSETRFEDLPAEAVEVARKLIVDTLGVIVAGSTAHGIATLVGWLQGQGGHAEATVLAYGHRLPAVQATWANAAMARAREFDDSHDASGDHISVPILPAALAAAELRGGVSGREFLAAYVLAADLVARLRLARFRRIGQTAFAANAFAPFSAAATAGLLLGLRGQPLYDALGWAYTQVAGALQLQQGGKSTLHIHHGLAASNGVLGALLARQGLPGAEDFLTGKFGFYNAYDAGEWDAAVVTDGLGTRYEIVGTSVKLYPSGRVIHGLIDAALALHAEERIDPTEIEEVVVPYTAGGFRMTCEPEAERRLPTNPQHAKFSLYYNVACGLVHGRVGIADFTPEALADEQVRAVAAKIHVPIDPNPRSNRPARVAVRLRDGREVERGFEHLRGTPENPITFEECAAKLRACVPFAARPLDSERVEQAIRLVADLESVDDVRPLATLLA
jgi:2-methylcitrate dehydratase PrpD